MEWCYEVVLWSGVMKWCCGVVLWSGVVEWCCGVVLWSEGEAERCSLTHACMELLTCDVFNTLRVCASGNGQQTW